MAARFFAPTRTSASPARAGAVKAGPPIGRPPTGLALRAPSTRHTCCDRDDDVEGSCGQVHEASCHILVCGGPKTQTMMQGYASAASSEAADPFLPTALKPSGRAGHRHLEPSSVP